MLHVPLLYRYMYCFSIMKSTLIIDSDELALIMRCLSPYSIYVLFKLYLCPSLACHQSISELQTTRLIKALRVSSRELKLSIDELTAHDLIKTSLQIDRVRVGRSSKVIQKTKFVESQLLSVVDKETLPLIERLLNNQICFERPLMIREIAFLIFCMFHGKSIAMTHKYIKARFKLDVSMLLEKIKSGSIDVDKECFTFSMGTFKYTNRCEFVLTLKEDYLAYHDKFIVLPTVFYLSDLDGFKVPFGLADLILFFENCLKVDKSMIEQECISFSIEHEVNPNVIPSVRISDFNEMFKTSFESLESKARAKIIKEVELVEVKFNSSELAEMLFQDYLEKLSKGTYTNSYLENKVRELIKAIKADKKITAWSFLIHTVCKFYVTELRKIKIDYIEDLKKEGLYLAKLTDNAPIFFDLHLDKSNNLLFGEEVFILKNVD